MKCFWYWGGERETQLEITGEGTGGVLFFTPSHNNTHAPAGLWGPFDGGAPHPVTHTHVHVQTRTHNINTNAHTHKGMFAPIHAHKGQVLV